MLGEYGGLAPGGAAAARDRLVATGEAAALSDDIRGYLLAALAKLCAQAGLPLGPAGEELVAAAAASHSADLQQRALELRALLACASPSACKISKSFFQHMLLSPHQRGCSSHNQGSRPCCCTASVLSEALPNMGLTHKDDATFQIVGLHGQCPAGHRWLCVPRRCPQTRRVRTWR